MKCQSELRHEQTNMDFDEPNWNFELDLHELENEYDADFDLGLDFDDQDDMDVDNQFGGGENFTIELKRQRKIPKFNIQGYEYTLKLDVIEDSVSYTTAAQMVHNSIRGKVFCILIMK